MGTFIGISGQIASGKSLIANYLHQNYKFELLSFRDFFIEFLNRNSIPINRDTLQTIGYELGQKIGFQKITKNLLINVVSNKNYIIDGIRHLDTYNYLKKSYKKDFYLIYKEVNEKMRWKNFNKRLVEHSFINLKEFQLINNAFVEREIPFLKAKADLIISYSSNLTKNYELLDSFIDKLPNSIKKRV